MVNDKINRSVLPIVVEEADELMNQAIAADKVIQSVLEKNNNTSSNDDAPLGKIIVANILIGLSIEIYLKAFMLAGRTDGIVQGHKLNELYKKLPPFLKKEIENTFQKQKKEHTLILEKAIITTEELPERPDKPPFDGVDFDDFNSSLNAVSNIFVESRYYFETINKENWSIIKYHFASAKAIALSLKSVLAAYRDGKFKGKGSN